MYIIRNILLYCGFILHLSGLNMMEGILTKNNWLRFPPKPKEAKLNIVAKYFETKSTAKKVNKHYGTLECLFK